MSTTETNNTTEPVASGVAEDGIPSASTTSTSAAFENTTKQENDQNNATSGNANLPPPDVAKQIPCRFFPMGTCKYGEQCAFAHVIPQGMVVTAGTTYYEAATQEAASQAKQPAGQANSPESQEQTPENQGNNKSGEQSKDAQAQGNVYMGYPNYYYNVYDPYGYKPIIQTQGQANSNGEYPNMPYYPYYYDQAQMDGVAPSYGASGTQQMFNNHHYSGNRFNFRGNRRNNNGQHSSKDSISFSSGTPHSGSKSRHDSRGPAARNAVPCTFFELNKCRNGDECTFVHMLPDGSDARTLGQGMVGIDGRRELSPSALDTFNGSQASAKDGNKNTQNATGTSSHTGNSGNGNSSGNNHQGRGYGRQGRRSNHSDRRNRFDDNKKNNRSKNNEPPKPAASPSSTIDFPSLSTALSDLKVSSADSTSATTSVAPSPKLEPKKFSFSFASAAARGASAPAPSSTSNTNSPSKSKSSKADKDKEKEKDKSSSTSTDSEGDAKENKSEPTSKAESKISATASEQ